MLQISDIHRGMKLRTTNRFECIAPNQIVTVLEGQDGKLFFTCRRGKHYIDASFNGVDVIAGLEKIDD